MGRLGRVSLVVLLLSLASSGCRMGSDGADPALAPGSPSDAERPHVVVILGCTVRQDQTSPYGGLVEVTPVLHELAQQGAVFSEAFTAGAWTRISSSSIFTGRHFRTIGMAEPGPGPNRRALAPELVTMAEVFQSAGYYTVGAVANPNLNRAFGFDQGYDLYWEATERYKDGGIKVPGRTVVEKVLTVLDRNERGDRPLFLSVVMLDAHEPALSVGPEQASRYISDGAPLRVGKYRAMLHRFDAAVGQLWRGLNARGYDSTNTVIVLVNDHGEGMRYPTMADGGGHGRYLRPSVTGMTWVVQGRGVRAGHQIRGVASQVDVLPTLLGVAGLPAPEGVDGHDWSALLRGSGSRTTADAVFVDTEMSRSDRTAIFTNDRACIIDFNADPPSRECWDRRTDPQLSGDPLAQPDERVLQRLETWRQEVDAKAEAFPYTRFVSASAAEMKMLEALGYAQEDVAE